MTIAGPRSRKPPKGQPSLLPIDGRPGGLGHCQQDRQFKERATGPAENAEKVLGAILLVVVKVRMSDSEHLEGGSDTRPGGRMYTEVNRGTAQFNLNLFHSGEKQLTSGACRMDSESAKPGVTVFTLNASETDRWECGLPSSSWPPRCQ